MNHTSKKRRSLPACLAAALLGAATILATATATAGTTACAICGKNLIKNPGAEAGLGITAVDASGAVPGWTNVAGEFGAASYSFPNGWFSARSTGPKNRGKNYFFGGTTRAAVEAQATIGKQTIKLPAAAIGKTATLSGWLGNYSKNTAQVRAQFEDAAGKLPLGGQDRPGYDDRRDEHDREEPQRQGAGRSQAGDGRRDVRRRRNQLQARRGGRALVDPALTGSAELLRSTRRRCRRLNVPRGEPVDS